MLMPGVKGTKRCPFDCFVFSPHFVAFSVLLGIIALFSPIQSVVNILASIQGLWWLTAAITLLVRSGKVYNTASMNK